MHSDISLIVFRRYVATYKYVPVRICIVKVLDYGKLSVHVGVTATAVRQGG